MQIISDFKELFSERIPKYWQIIGSGGKTSSLINAVKLLNSSGCNNILYTTTVHMAAPLCCAEKLAAAESADSDEWRSRFVDYPGSFVPYESFEELRRFWQESEAPRVMMTGRLAVKNGVPKLTGLTGAEVYALCALPGLDYLLIEADGSRQLPVKVHAGHEPVLFSRAEMGAAVIGMQGLGRRVCEGEVHRPELMRKLLNCDSEHVIDENDFVTIASSYLDKLPTPMHAVIFSQAEDTDEERLQRLAAGLWELRGAAKPICFLVQALFLST